jgi:phosphopentomutase
MAKKRVFLVVLDGVGAGEMPDAGRFGDEGSNTLGNTARAVGGLNLPVMGVWGLGNITEIMGVPPVAHPAAAFGRMAEASPGKDTTTGHWEMMGLVLEKPFPVYPQGFPPGLIKRFAEAVNRGVLGNKPASGTEIIEELGPEHMRTGALIVYTSADSVFQIAAHEEVVPPEELYEICQTARAMLMGEDMVARVIARPFTGQPGAFRRTERRRDFSLAPPDETLLDFLSGRGIKTVGVGKIKDIFAGRGLVESYHTGNNRKTMEKVLELAREEQAEDQTETLVFANCVDFDTLYGHRNDPRGFAGAIEEADQFLGELAGLLGKEDLLIVTADHGCDPTTASTDHSREYVPLLVVGETVAKGKNLGTRKSFADISATLAQVFSCTGWVKGESFYRDLKK